MKIVFVSSEVYPFSKTGGLADVSGALPIELARLGHEVLVVTPLYQSVDRARYGVEPAGKTLLVPVAGRMEPAEVFSTGFPGNAPGLTTMFVSNQKYFERKALYGEQGGDYHDNAERFAFFSRAVPELLRAFGFKPDIVHCNDWQSGPVVAHLKTSYSGDAILAGAKCVVTIHNLGYQGLFGPYAMDTLMLPPGLFNYRQLEFWGKVNYLKSGLVFADAITTVSRKYAEEIRTEEFGCGLQGLLEERKSRLYGILNGVDYETWNPETDTNIAATFSSEDLHGKDVCKTALQKELGMAPSSAPLLGIISRLADQKGFDLLADAGERMIASGCQLAVLGTGDGKYHEYFIGLKDKHPGSVGLLLGFDNALAHKIEAGSDMFLMPSRYEPCGLNQMYSLKYGTIPVVRAVGGLDDTIEDYASISGRRNGFKFTEYTSHAMLEAVARALDVFKNRPAWKKLIKNAMECDFSWGASARNYSALYERLTRG
jgi:starch synthase